MSEATSVSSIIETTEMTNVSTKRVCQSGEDAYIFQTLSEHQEDMHNALHVSVSIHSKLLIVLANLNI